jgi:DNA polymerase III subunit alpha
VVTTKRNEALDQFDLFSTLDSPTDGGQNPLALPLALSGTEWPPKEKLSFEREMLGLYVSAHPLDGCERILARHREQVISDLFDEEMPDRKPVVLAGMIASVTQKTTKMGAIWAIVALEDMTGTVEVLFFPKAYESIAPYLIPDEVVAISGTLNRRDGEVSVYGNDVALLEVSAPSNGVQPVVLTSSLVKVNARWAEELKRVLAAHPGDAPVRLNLVKPDRSQLRLDLGPFRVSNSVAFRSEIKMLLGAGGIE